MFRSLFSRKAPLAGAPAARRIKSYTAASGYAYQHRYEGSRRIAKPAGVEFVFSVASARAPFRQVSVTLPDDVVASWQAQRARELSATECYAIAKLALLRALDDYPVPEAVGDELRVSASVLDAIAETLGWD